METRSGVEYVKLLSLKSRLVMTLPISLFCSVELESRGSNAEDWLGRRRAQPPYKIIGFCGNKDLNTCIVVGQILHQWKYPVAVIFSLKHEMEQDPSRRPYDAC